MPCLLPAPIRVEPIRPSNSLSEIRKSERLDYCRSLGSILWDDQVITRMEHELKFRFEVRRRDDFRSGSWAYWIFRDDDVRWSEGSVTSYATEREAMRAAKARMQQQRRLSNVLQRRIDDAISGR